MQTTWVLVWVLLGAPSAPSLASAGMQPAATREECEALGATLQQLARQEERLRPTWRRVPVTPVSR